VRACPRDLGAASDFHDPRSGEAGNARVDEPGDDRGVAQPGGLGLCELELAEADHADGRLSVGRIFYRRDFDSVRSAYGKRAGFGPAGSMPMLA
jgi:hypothetical protein